MTEQLADKTAASSSAFRLIQKSRLFNSRSRIHMLSQYFNSRYESHGRNVNLSSPIWSVTCIRSGCPWFSEWIMLYRNSTVEWGIGMITWQSQTTDRGWGHKKHNNVINIWNLMKNSSWDICSLIESACFWRNSLWAIKAILLYWWIWNFINLSKSAASSLQTSENNHNLP